MATTSNGIIHGGGKLRHERDKFLKTLRFEQLFEEDIRDLAKIQEIGQMEVLAELLRHQVGQLTSYESLAKKVRFQVLQYDIGLRF